MAAPRPRSSTLAGLAVLLALGCGLGGGRDLRGARADPSTEARTPAEVYERRSQPADALLYVVGDLKARVGTPPKGDAALLLVIDPTSSLANDLPGLAAGLEQAFRDGPPGLHVGIQAVGGDLTVPSMTRTRARSALEALALVPVEGVKNLLAEVRKGVQVLARLPVTGPKALLLVTEEGGDGEDDVEATRAALFDAGVSFYALAGEAAFERGWAYDFEARKDDVAGWVERFGTEPRKKETSLYFGGDVAFGLVPYRWELDLAQTEFLWAQPPRYPVPSGFGYWPLASLAYTSGGRYFLHDFAAAALPAARGEKRKTLYDVSRLALLAPDLRPRARILKDLAKDGRARTIVRVWEHLADDALPLVGALGTHESSGGTLVGRPARPIRSTVVPDTWYDDEDDLKKAHAWADARVVALDQALSWWAAENAKARPERPGEDPLLERVEADFQLLGAQLKRARFHLGEAKAALGTIRALDVTQRRARLLPAPLAMAPAAEGVRPTPDLGDPERNARLADLQAVIERVRSRYAETPWALLLEKSFLITFKKDVRIVEPEEPEPKKPEPEPKAGKAPAAPPKPPPAPPAPPPAGPRPGSGGAGPTSGR